MHRSTSSRTGATNLVANFLPVQFDATTLQVGVVPFESREQLVSLRDDLKATHVVRREGERVVCVPLSPGVAEVGEQEKLEIGEHRMLTVRLVQDALVRQVVAWGYKLRRFVPPVFVSRMPERDLLSQCPSARRAEISDLHVYPEYRLDARVSGPSYLPGMVVGLKARYEIDVTVADLMRHGVPIEGLYVLAKTGEMSYKPDLDARAYRRAVGAVERVDGNRLCLRDAPLLAEVEAHEAWLEGRRENFHTVLGALTGDRHSLIVDELDDAVFKLVGAEGRLERITSIAQRLGEIGPFTIAHGLQATIGMPIGSPASRHSRLQSTRLPSPTFVFDPAGDKTGKSVEKGLDEFGPFDSEFFNPHRIRIMVVTPKAFQGTVETFMSRFRDGVPGAKVFRQGFARKYRLTGCDITIRAFDGDPRDAAAYRDACLSSLDAVQNPRLAIVVTSEMQQQQHGDDSPYLVAKSTLMGHGVPVQEVQIETMQNNNIAYPLDSIALACYAKLGGIPFVISAPRAIAHELVVGIGSAQVTTSRLSDPERVVGITTVFSADGNYILSNTSREVDYDNYPDELLRTLRTCIHDVETRNAWRTSDALRLIFHVFKPLKDVEAEAVKRLVGHLTEKFESVEFAFVHVSDQHDWALFDTDSAGVGNARSTSTSSRAKGILVPHRGHAVTLSRSEVLLTVAGPYDMKLATQGLPRPLLLKLHRASTFTDIDYLAAQAYRFTALSWRRPYPSSKPVTIMYSDLIASLLGRLRHVRNWNSDIVSTKLRTSRWFL